MRGGAGLRLTGDAVVGLVGLVLSLWLFVVAGDLPSSALVPIGPGFYPRLVLGVTALSSLALLVQSLIASRAGAAPRAGGANYALVVTAFVLFGLYVIALPLIGYRLATFLFVALMQVAIDPPRSHRARLIVGVIALATSLVTYLVFEHYLQVLLPRGTWTDF
jgi:putative tricarboxylic transport membrane protein